MSGRQLTFDATPEELILFMSEGEEQLEILDRDILRLETEGDTNSELLQGIFRAAHTLKGSSGAIGHQRMARLTHALETVLDQVRNHKLAISTTLIDLLLKGLDALTILLNEVRTYVESDVTIDDLCKALVDLAQGKPPTEVPPIAVTTAAVAAAPDTSAKEAVTPLAANTVTAPTWIVTVDVDKECPLPGARALQAALALQAIGTVTASTPTWEDIEHGRFTHSDQLQVHIATNNADAPTLISKCIARIIEVSLNQIVGPDGSLVEVVTPNDTDWQLVTTVDIRCPLPAVRALQIALALGKMGKVTPLHPTMAEIEAGQVTIGTPLSYLLHPENADVSDEGIRKALNRIPDVIVQTLTTGHQELPKEAMKYTPIATIDTAEFSALLASDPIIGKNLQENPAPVLEQLTTPASVQPVHEVAKEAKNDAEVATPDQQRTASPTPNHAPRMVRIDVERLDALMNLVGELVIDRTRLARIAGRIATHTEEPVLVEELTETCRHLARISDDLQDEVMRSRMLPIESVFSKFPRLVRDLAQKVNKHVEFIVEGKDTELDRSVAEQISDPIIHLLRNSIDHGIEPNADREKTGKGTGQIRLSARHEENQIVIDVEDDGRGINGEFLKSKAISKGILTAEAAARLNERETLELIFASGFSTAEQISDISGRGVGMDIVRTNVERLNGSITVETEVGQGTRFTVRLPLTLAIIRALLIDIAGQVYAIPLTSVVEALRIDSTELRAVNGHEAIELRGQVLPLLRLAKIFQIEQPQETSTENNATQETQDAKDDRSFVVAVRWGERRTGLVVDALIGEQEIVIKSLGSLFRNTHGISGGAVLDDGKVAPILDIAALIKHVLIEQGVAV